MEVKVEMQFKCPKCKEIIEHNYTEKDLLNRTHLELVCQNCGHCEKIETKILIEKAKQEAIKEIKKNYKTI